jgi:predicted nucleotidyltransferase
MAVVPPADAPTRADAERAAATLIAAGVDKVLLFGSVARGGADPHSDIDLVGIFADLDYAERHVRRGALQEAASAAVPWPVQVHVTDRPEWRARVERVATSFEHRIAADAVTVATAPRRRPVDWDKEMVLPMSDAAEALRHFRQRVIPRLQDVARTTRQDHLEADLRAPAARREQRRLNRMVSLCAAAAITAETSLKGLAMLYGEPTPTEQELRRLGHDIAAVLDRVPNPARREAVAILDRLDVDLEALSRWRRQGTYPDDADVLRAEADRLAARYAVMAPKIAGVLAAHLQQETGPDGVLDDTVAELDDLAAEIAGQDVRPGVPAAGDLNI